MVEYCMISAPSPLIAIDLMLYLLSKKYCTLFFSEEKLTSCAPGSHFLSSLFSSCLWFSDVLSGDQQGSLGGFTGVAMQLNYR